MQKETNDTTDDKPVRLSTAETYKTFHSLLRRSTKNLENAPEKTYLFPRGECPPPKTLPEAKSNIVDFQGNDNSKYIAARKVKYVQDNVVLNDADRDYKPINRFQKKRFSKVESDTSNQYSDEVKYNLQANSNLSRKIRENYAKNPINVMNQTQIQDYNTEQRGKMINHSRAVTEYLSSKGVMKSFLTPTTTTQPNESRDININRPTNVNTVPASMLKTAINQKKQEPSYAHKGFKSYLIGNKNQVSFV